MLQIGLVLLTAAIALVDLFLLLRWNTNTIYLIAGARHLERRPVTPSRELWISASGELDPSLREGVTGRTSLKSVHGKSSLQMSADIPWDFVQ